MGKIQNITVKVESIETGEVVKFFDCDKNERRAEKLEKCLLEKTNLDKYHVYQSVYFYDDGLTDDGNE